MSHNQLKKQNKVRLSNKLERKECWLATLLLSTVLTAPALSNVVGNPTQNFNPTTGSQDYTTVQSGRVLEPGRYNLGLFLNYATNTLPYFEDNDQNQGRLSVNDSVLNADLIAGMGVLPRLELGLAVPALLVQQKGRDGYRGRFADTGVTDWRLAAKIGLFASDLFALAFIETINLNRTEDNPYLGPNPSPIWTSELAADTRLGIANLAFNIGYRHYGGDSFENEPVSSIKDEFTESAGIHFPLRQDLAIVGEIFAMQPVSDVVDDSDRSKRASEMSVGTRHKLGHDLTLHTGLGTELHHGLSTPDWRLVGGITWSPENKAPEPAPAPVAATPPPPPAPAKPFTGEPKPKENIVINDILFEFDSDKLLVGSAADTLSQLVKYLDRKPKYRTLIINGHTDSKGPVKYNQNLSLRRSKRIKDYLVSKFRLDPKTIEVKGYGPSKPIASNDNETGRQLNRRVEFTILRENIAGK